MLWVSGRFFATVSVYARLTSQRTHHQAVIEAFSVEKASHHSPAGPTPDCSFHETLELRRGVLGAGGRCGPSDTQPLHEMRARG
jgi:hypothetical protein